MEEEASQRFDDDKSLSRDLIDFVQHMVREHGEDYKVTPRGTVCDATLCLMLRCLVLWSVCDATVCL